MISLRDEQVRAAADALNTNLVEMLERAGPGHAVGWRLKPAPIWRAAMLYDDPWRETLEYETHLVELDAAGGFEGVAGFHYVTLRQP